MQQATTVKPPDNSAPNGAAAPHRSLRNRFVINLCGSTTPVSLTPPDHAGLKRFTFFVSRRREEGRERFRLHMGYFDSQEEAERLLDIVREIYPAAWAGLAPGQRLQAQAEAAAAAAASAAQTQAPADVPAGAPASVNTAATVTASVTASVATAPATVTAPPSASAAPSPQPATVQEVALQDGTAVMPALSLIPDAGRRIAQDAPAQAPPTRTAPARTTPARDDTDAAARALSNVRAAIASLGDTTTTRAPTLSPLPELKPVARQNVAGVVEAREISDSAALKVLETPAARTAASISDSTVNQPRLPVTEPSAATKGEKTAFAVQLLWSVQPIDISQIPQLAIFSAYTLYGAEGNRDGRRWYGVRLGFFTDAVSAKQVAHYVRSDFSTVSVVPVTVRERERAKLASTRPDATPVVAAAPAAAAAAAEPKPAATTAFEFIEDKQQPSQGRAAAAGASPAARSLRGAPGKRAKVRAGRPINGRAKTKPMTLEETLEILGAGELKIDDGRRALINDSAPRPASADASKEKPSRFGRLLERLSERLGS